MFIKNTFVFFALFFVVKVYSQEVKYENALNKAIAHQQTQNAANVVLWNSEHFLLNVDSSSFDQYKGQLIVKSGKYRVTYNIKILGTYDQQDTTFLWSSYNSSIHKDLTTPVSN